MTGEAIASPVNMLKYALIATSAVGFSTYLCYRFFSQGKNAVPPFQFSVVEVSEVLGNE